MSLIIVKKSTRRLIGGTVAFVLTGTLVYAFLDSYAKAKRQQVPKTDLVELNIVASTPAAQAPILYEAVPTEECIKQITFNSTASSEALTTSSLAISSISKSSVGTATSVNAQAQSSAKPIVREPKLVQASSPKCIKQTPIPAGVELLAKDAFVGLELNLAVDGHVERGEVEASSGNEELDKAALKQVSETWHFEPCVKASVAMACKTHIRFRWQVK